MKKLVLVLPLFVFQILSAANVECLREQNHAQAQAQVAAHSNNRVFLEAGKVVALPLLFALGHGLLNNLLARNAGCGVKRWFFYEAPAREFATGSAALLGHMLFFRNIIKNSQLNVSQKKFSDLERRSLLSGAWFIYSLGTGIMQEVGETVRLPGYEGYRSFSSFLAQQKFGVIHSVFSSEMRSLSLTTGLYGLSSIGVGALMNTICG